MAQEQQAEGVQCHWVGSSAARRRTDKRRLVKIGDYVVVKNDDPDTPWFVGVVCEEPELPENPDTEDFPVKVHECGNASGCLLGKHDPIWMQIVPTNRVRNDSTGLYEMQSKIQYTQSNLRTTIWKPDTNEVSADTLIDWGSKKAILKKDRKLKKATLKCISENNLVNWSMS